MKDALLFFLTLLLTVFPAAQTVTHWRGADARGVYAGQNLLPSWPATGPALVWCREDVGNGYGSPSVTADRVYLTGEVGGTCWLFAFDLNGVLLWKTDCGKEWVRTYPGSRSQPTVVGNQIYVCSGQGVVSCADARKGTRLWSVDMVKELGGRAPMHGYAESLLVDGNRVFAVPGGAEHNVVALDRMTGKRIWSCRGAGETPAYNSPVLVKTGNRKVLVTFSSYHLLGIDASNGKLLWTHEQVNTPVAQRKPGNGDTHANSVWFENGFLYYVAGDGNGAVKLKLESDGSRVSQIWRTADVDNYQGGFIKIGPVLYSPTSEKKVLLCLSESSGQVMATPRLGSGTLVSDGRRLYLYTLDGTVQLVDPHQGRPEVVSSFKISKGTKEHFAHPVIAQGRLFLRHGQALMVYNLHTR